MLKVSPISLGDLAKSLGDLDVKDIETQRVIAGLLNLPYYPTGSVYPEIKITKEFPSDSKITKEISPDRKDLLYREELPYEESQEKPIEEDSVKEKKEIEGQKRSTSTFVQNLGKANIVSEPVPEDISALPIKINHFAPRPPLDPLFAPQQVRSLLISTLSIAVDDGDIDVEKLVNGIAERRVFEGLPRHRVKTMRRGLQLLIDKSNTLVPFRRDQNWLAQEIRMLIGPDLLEERNFIGSPLKRMLKEKQISGDFIYESYFPPPRNTPVLLLTNLGIAPIVDVQTGLERASVSEWLQFAQVLRKAACPIIAFIPYSEERWPSELSKVMSLRLWDRKHHTKLPRHPKPLSSDRKLPEALNDLNKLNPDALRLALLASLAVRVEPELLRCLRRKVLDAEVNAESDLWFSSLVEVRNPLAINFYPDILDDLRMRLKEEFGGSIEDIHKLLGGFRNYSESDSLQVSEDLIYLGITNQIDSAKEKLLRINKAFSQEGRQIAPWILTGFDTLPKEVRGIPLTKQLFNIAQLRYQSDDLPKPETLFEENSLALSDHLMVSLISLGEKVQVI